MGALYHQKIGPLRLQMVVTLRPNQFQLSSEAFQQAKGTSEDSIDGQSRVVCSFLLAGFLHLSWRAFSWLSEKCRVRSSSAMV